MKKSPATLSDLIKTAMRFENAGSFKEAETAYQAILAQDSRQADASILTHYLKKS